MTQDLRRENAWFSICYKPHWYKIVKKMRWRVRGGGGGNVKYLIYDTQKDSSRRKHFHNSLFV